jgi:hypothetical protein
MKSFAFILLICWAFPAAAANGNVTVLADTTAFDTASCPRAELRSGPLHARFYLPDAQKGYYRSTRFDWSGVIAGLDYNGHNFFGHWNQRYDPTLHDAILGPVESFTPSGYDQAQPGGSFLQPGVGILTRPDTGRYTPFRYYPIQNTGYWNITKAPGAISFRQDLNAAGYTYVYIKTIILDPNQPRMTITHTLKNTGGLAIESDVYNHNFFVFDTLTVGPGRVLKLPWTPTAAPSDKNVFDSLAAVQGDSIIIRQYLTPRRSFYTLLTGYSEKATDYDLRLEDQRSKTGVRIQCDHALVKLAYWSSLHTACPEPFIHIKAAPGETITWTFSYDFYSLEP